VAIRAALLVKPRSPREARPHVAQIADAIRKQNTVNPAGQVGGEPVQHGQEFTYSVRAQGRLETPEEFGEIILRANPDGPCSGSATLPDRARRADVHRERALQRRTGGCAPRCINCLVRTRRRRRRHPQNATMAQVAFSAEHLGGDPSVDTHSRCARDSARSS
jgi:hypothetical protein